MGVPLQTLYAMPEADFALLLHHASEQGTPWDRIEVLLTRIAYMVGAHLGLSKDLADYSPRPRRDPATPAAAGSEPEPPDLPDFNPVNKRKRPPT